MAMKRLAYLLISFLFSPQNLLHSMLTTHRFALCEHIILQRTDVDPSTMRTGSGDASLMAVAANMCAKSITILAAF
jgi:hypothetical protein